MLEKQRWRELSIRPVQRFAYLHLVADTEGKTLAGRCEDD